MNNIELKEYLLHILNELNFPFDGDKHKRISIPESYQHRFHHADEIELKEDDFSKDHPFVQTLLSLWNEHQPHRFLSVKGEPFIYFVYKTSIRNHFVDEYISSYRYDIDANTVSFIELNEISSLLETAEITGDSSDLTLFQRAEQKVTEVVRKDAIAFMKEKQEEWKPILHKEIRRIKEYYILVKQEHINSFTEHTYSDYEVMASEKDQLIQRQMDKYRYRLEDAETFPLLIVYSH